MPKSVFEKLQYRGGDVLILAAPDGFDAHAAGLSPDIAPRTNARSKGPYALALGFAEMQRDLPLLVDRLVARVEEDGLLWLAYPKKSSKRYRSDIGRDTDAWSILGEHGFEPVRQIALDDDWSALRFRRVEHIKTMRRDEKYALSKAGKRRTRG